LSVADPVACEIAVNKNMAATCKDFKYFGCEISYENELQNSFIHLFLSVLSSIIPIMTP
jgi:hypothetical protein